MAMILVGFVSLILLVILGVAAQRLEQVERAERLAEVALETSRLLDASLEERLGEMNRYRHDLAALLQELDYEQVRAAEEQGDA